LALACINHAKYGTCAATYDSALGPCHAPACTAPSTAVSSSAIDAYSALNELHAPAAANNDAGPGPLLSNVEWTSGGEAIQIGAVIVGRSECDSLSACAVGRSNSYLVLVGERHGKVPALSV
jgi:hypothetical protein